MKAIIVKYVDDIEGVVVVNDDLVEDTLIEFQEANDSVGGSLSFELHVVDDVQDTLNFIKSA